MRGRGSKERQRQNNGGKGPFRLQGKRYQSCEMALELVSRWPDSLAVKSLILPDSRLFKQPKRFEL